VVIIVVVIIVVTVHLNYSTSCCPNSTRCCGVCKSRKKRDQIEQLTTTASNQNRQMPNHTFEAELIVSSHETPLVKNFTVELSPLLSLSSPSSQQHQQSKKFNVIHIRPSKTGTLAIQMDFAQNLFRSNTLEQDKVIYVGKRFSEDWMDPNYSTPIPRNQLNHVRGLMKESVYHSAVKCIPNLLITYHNSNKASD